MSLRLRLTLFYTVLVALVVGVSGLALRLSLNQTLRSSLDQSLKETAALIKPTLLRPEEEGSEHSSQQYHLSEGALAQLPSEVSLVLLATNGKVLFSNGRIPAGLKPQMGFVQTGNWRVYGEDLGFAYLLTLRPLELLEESLNRFDRLFLLIFPLALLVSLGLGYWLMKRVLAPAEHLTRTAYALAQSRDWHQRLPEPKTQDELWRVARSVNTLLGTLDQAIERERRFTQDAAHELRTPLTVLQGRLERALETGDIAQVKPALRASRNLLGLVEKLLALARADQGQGLKKENLALDEMALEVAEDFQALFVEKGLSFDLELSENSLWVQADATALQLALRNLLENALKFTENGSITLRVQAVGLEALVQVEDSGSGIAPAALPHIFEPFYQADIAHRPLGSGLGLALVARLIEQHQGRVWAENRAGGGAVIGFALPLQQGASGAD